MRTQIFEQFEQLEKLKLLLKNKKIAVHGLGVSGLKTLELLNLIKKYFINDLEIWAINQGEIESWKSKEELQLLLDKNFWISEENPKIQQIFASIDLIILGPGIPREHKTIELARASQKNISIWSEIELAFHFYNPISPHSPPIIAVTGSNGKTTTVSIIEDIFKNMGLNPFVGGNIGLPFSEYAISVIKNIINFDVIVLELSSFQLESIYSFKPNIAILTNLSLTHTERYSTFESYALAKFNISKNMQGNKNNSINSSSNSDILIYTLQNGPNQSRELVTNWIKKQDAHLQITCVDEGNISQIKSELEQNFSLQDFNLIGHHNLVNLFLAAKAVSAYNNVKWSKALQQTIDNFHGVHYRIEKIKFDNDNTDNNFSISFYNDAKSTNLDATKKAVEAITQQQPHDELYLIYGGKKRTESAGTIWNNVFETMVKHIFLIGETTDELAKELEGKISFSKSYTLDNVIISIKEKKHKNMNKGIAVLFSPGYPSFDQFENYVKRGAYFEKIVLKEFPLDI
ncbi:MAG: UDP-N-acetylmuramoyl-L-alanine--D-glutamate ligase [Oligoflexia bacterium]|nr:UDP-N-acetylmuramoyl-L-alanine--D-glutamate ligase [Oligoflexia bacterium]